MKPWEIDFTARSSSAVRKLFATKSARTAARASPPQIAIAFSTSASRSTEGSAASSAILHVGSIMEHIVNNGSPELSLRKMIATLGEALDAGWRLTIFCRHGKRDGMKSIRECAARIDADLQPLSGRAAASSQSLGWSCE